MCLRLRQCQQGGRSSVGQKHTSAVEKPEEIPALATASVMEELVCWNAFGASVSPLVLCFSHSPLPLF